MKYMAIIYGNKALWESFSGEQAAEAIAALSARLVVYFSPHSSASAAALRESA